MKKIKLLFKACIFLLLPSWLLRIFGVKIGNHARVGFSIVLVEQLEMGQDTRIGHFNLIKLQRLHLEAGACIGKLNRISGNTLNIHIHKNGAIGDENWIHRAGTPVTYGIATLEIGVYSKITFKHHVDCTRSISIGDYSVLAGLGSQIWTHGYFHADQGIERIRIDGEVKIGNNVNISSACVINSGVTISDGITVGSNVCVSKSLLEKGMYVSQGLRCIPKDINSIREGYRRVEGFTLEEEVYVRE